MSTLKDVQESAKGWIVMLALGYTVFFTLGVSAKAGSGHHWTSLFSIPSYLPVRWLYIFYGLWAFYWLATWYRVRGFLKDPLPAKKVYAGSWTALIGLAIVWYYLSHSQLHTWHRFVYNQGTRTMEKGLTQLLGLTFPLVLSGAVLLWVGERLDLNYIDPLEREFKQKINWTRKPNHLKYLKKAFKKGLTYAGYEVTFKKPSFLNHEERNGHLHVVGTTGSGKTRYVMLPLAKQDIEQGRGVLFVDAKGSFENALSIYKMAIDAGREKDFLLFTLTPGDHSCTYNPLQLGNATQLQDKISASIQWSEPFYERICDDALQVLFMEVKKHRESITLNGLHEILNAPPDRFPRFKEMAQAHKEKIQSLRSEIGSVVNTDFGHLFNAAEAEIDLLKAYKEGKIVCFSLDTQTYAKSAKRVGKMLTQDINALSGIVESRQVDIAKRPFCVYIDEFQDFGTKEFKALAKGRSSGLWITLAHQSMGDLNDISPNYAQQVNESTNAKIFLRVNDPETAETFAHMVGTYKAREYTKQLHFTGEAPKNTMGTASIGEKFKIHPTELKTLKIGQAVFKLGSRWGRLILNGYFEDTSGIKLPEHPRAILKIPPPHPPQRSMDGEDRVV